MISVASAAASAPGILARLKTAASAEDFFRMLGVGYDEKLLSVARLHILKRMGDYLTREDLADLPDDVSAARCKSVLERAYEDFAASSPLEHRVFKVLKDAVATKRADFVPLDELLKPR